ncbi:hypothetical protein ACFLY2_01270 [Patescibacteria group bacterium]
MDSSNLLIGHFLSPEFSVFGYILFSFLLFCYKNKKNIFEKLILVVKSPFFWIPVIMGSGITLFFYLTILKKIPSFTVNNVALEFLIGFASFVIVGIIWEFFYSIYKKSHPGIKCVE